MLFPKIQDASSRIALGLLVDPGGIDNHTHQDL
jgi:hypothetical protein